MENQKNNIQKSYYDSNNHKTHFHKNNNSLIINSYDVNQPKINTSLNKPISLKNTFKSDNRLASSTNLHHNQGNTFNNNNSIDIKKYYSDKIDNINNVSINDNQDKKSNYSMQSNSSSSTIKSMVKLINMNNKSSNEFSFQKIKCRNYPLESSNSSRISHEGNHLSKYMSTNYSLSHDIQNKISKEFNNQKQDMNNSQMNILIKQKIENAKLNEEIILPSYDICLDSLTINKPIKIKGDQNSCLYINNGPILIDLEDFNKNGKKNNNNNFIKFSQLKIIYNDSKVNKDKKITSLFKLHPSTFLELEDCDIGFHTFSNKKSNNKNIEKKSVAFLLSSNKAPENNNNSSINTKNNNIININPTILTLTNTRIHNFYQSIRSGQNCIVNIIKSAFIQNSGKAIVMINPISLRINESIFQNNMDNTVHVKYIEDCLYEEKRKIFINKNEFHNTLGNHVCIEGIKTFKLDVSLVITKNNFLNGNTDGVLAYDLLYNFFEVTNNTFQTNQGNGLNIQKSFYNGVFLSLNKNILYQKIKIKDNQFIENKGFGLFINNCIIEATSNKFATNRQSGMFLCNIAIDNPQKGFDGIKQVNNNNYNIIEEDDYSSMIKEMKRSSDLIKNSFNENGDNGLLIHGYPYIVNISESVFTRNCRHGLSIDLELIYNNKNINLKKNNRDFNTLLSEFKACNNHKMLYDLADIRINNCVIEKNMKNGLKLNFCFIFCEESFIINNLDYAIYTKKNEFQYCFKNGKKNVISGGIGGDWGKIDVREGGCGFFCMGAEKYDLSKKKDIEQKVPKLLNESSYEENFGGKNYSYDIFYNKDKLEKNENIDKSLAKSEKNKNIYKNIKNKQESKDCSIF